MYVIIIGCGKVGSKFANVLADEGHDVVIVDNDIQSFEKLDPEFSGLKLVGVPIDQDILKKAGIQNADALACVTPDDNINIMVGQIAKEIYNVPRVLARIFNPSREYVFQQFGLDTICPTNITVDTMKSQLLGDAILPEHIIGINTISYKCEKPPKAIVGRSLDEIELPHSKSIIGIQREDNFYFYDGRTIVEKNDILIIASIVD